MVRAFAFPFQRSTAAGRHQQFMAAFVELGPGVFHGVGLGGMRLADLDFIKELFAHCRVSQSIDIEHCQFRAQQRVFKAIAFAEPADGVEPVIPARARNHLTFVAEQILGDIPAAVELANNLMLRHRDIVKEGFAERRISADQQDRLGRNAGARHVEQQERDALILVGLVGPDQTEDPVSLVGIRGPDLAAIDDPMIALVFAKGLE